MSWDLAEVTRRLLGLEREHRLLLGQLAGSPVVCWYSPCVRRELGSDQPLQTPHVHMPGECYPKGEDAEERMNGKPGNCFHCSRSGPKTWWWSLPKPWHRTTDDGVTWEAGWLCRPCIQQAADMILQAATTGERLHLDGCVGARDHQGRCWFAKVQDRPLPGEDGVS